MLIGAKSILNELIDTTLQAIEFLLVRNGVKIISNTSNMSTHDNEIMYCIIFDTDCENVESKFNSLSEAKIIIQNVPVNVSVNYCKSKVTFTYIFGGTR